MKHQQGQSLVEFAVAVLVLVSLSLGMRLLASYHDIQRQAMLAAREMVFSASWRSSLPPAAAQSAQVKALHLQQPGWRDPTSQVALLAGAEDVAAQLSQGPPPGRAAPLLNGVLRPLQSVSDLAGSGFDLSAQRFFHAQVDVQLPALAHLPEPWPQLSLQLKEPAALLTDTWSAAGPQQVARRAAAMVPSHLFAQPLSLVTPLLRVTSLFEPSLRQLCVGLIEPERVPEDRLSINTRHIAQPGQAGCR
jgi:hypothetical protein